MVKEFFKHFFIPQETNNHRAKAIHSTSLVYFLLALSFFQLTLVFTTHRFPQVLGYASNITAEEVIRYTNDKRLAEGLAPLEINVELNEVAQRKAGDMFAFNYWAHVSPSGRDPWSFFKEVGYDYLYAGENLARDFNDSISMIEAWMGSTKHRENILSKDYTQIGLAVVNGKLKGVETTLVVQVFGRPASSKLAAKPPTVKGDLGEASQIAGEYAYAPAISPFVITKVVTIFVLGILFGALLVDLLIVSRRRVVRVAGKNLAHLLFVGILLLTVLLTFPGAIL